MEHSSLLSDYQILIFLLEVLVILVLNHLVSKPFRRAKLSTIPAEMLIGIVLGPTVLARLSPELFSFLFPAVASRHYMLETVGWIGILFMLLVTGMSFNLQSAFRQRKQVLSISLPAILVPFVVGMIASLMFGNPSGTDQLLFSLLFACFVAFASMPVSMRILSDMKILNSDFGILAGSTLSVVDLVGWISFTSLIASIQNGHIDILLFGRGFGLTALLTVLMLGSVWYARTRHQARLDKLRDNQEHMVTIVLITGITTGIATILIGVHALYGFFLAGLVIGESRIANAKTRLNIEKIMESFFIPVFFVSVGLRFDFIAHFHAGLFLFFSVVAIGLRFGGAWLGTQLAGMDPSNRLLLAASHLTSGELHIIMAMVAREAQLINDEMLVAIISGTVVSAIIASPLCGFFLARNSKFNIMDYLPSSGLIHRLSGNKKQTVLHELSVRAEAITNIDAAKLEIAINYRENQVSTAMGHRLAFPHARIAHCAMPLIICARSETGIDDWDSPDGVDVHLVFLIITDSQNDTTQLQILKLLGTALRSDSAVKYLIETASTDALFQALQTCFEKKPPGTPGGLV